MVVSRRCQNPLTRCWQAERALYCVKENEDALLSSQKFKNEYAFWEYNFNGCFITEQLPFSFIMEAKCIFFTFFHWCEHHLHHHVETSVESESNALVKASVHTRKRISLDANGSSETRWERNLTS